MWHKTFSYKKIESGLKNWSDYAFPLKQDPWIYPRGQKIDQDMTKTKIACEQEKLLFSKLYSSSLFYPSVSVNLTLSDRAFYKAIGPFTKTNLDDLSSTKKLDNSLINLILSKKK